LHPPAIAEALFGKGYTGVVGFEGWASGDSEAALERPSRWIEMPLRQSHYSYDALFVAAVELARLRSSRDSG
jgi:hypothetical protein